jgi:hypothetical protein
MTPEQFYELDEQEQAETVREGKHISGREDEEHMIVLYKIEDDLYIEAYVHKLYNVIRKFMAYREHELLDIYLQKN